MATAPSTRLENPWLTVVRVAWVILFFMAVGLYAASVLAEVDKPLPTCAAPEAECDALDFSAEDLEQIRGQGLPTGISLGISSVFELMLSLSFIVVATFIFWRRSDDWLALLLSWTLLILGAYGFSPANEYLLTILPEWRGALWLFDGLTYGPLLLIIFMFPTGQFAPRWMGFLAVPVLLVLPFVIALSDLLSIRLEAPVVVRPSAWRFTP
jgi:hypothetical protein